MLGGVARAQRFRPIRLRPGRRTLISLARNVAVLLVVVVLWELATFIFAPSSIALPTPVQVFVAFVQMGQFGFAGVPLQNHIAITFLRIVEAFAASLAVGVPLGLAMGSVPTVRKVVTPFITLFRPVPPFAWLAIFVVWFGLGEFPKVLLIFVGSVTIIALNTMDGILRVPREYREAAATLGASRMQVFWHVMPPAALPQILAGARVALVVAWTAVIAAELVAAQSGVGVIILQSAGFLRTDETFAGLILLSVLGGLTDAIMGRLQAATAAWGNR